jgi:CheY-like chemotaxis protein
VTIAERPRVLIVDDNQALLDRATSILSDACVVVGAVNDGASALEAVEALEPDVVVLDISMPGMSGLEVAVRLRSVGFSVPIVFCSVHDEDEFVRAAEAAGGIGYVVKRRISSDLVTAVMEGRAGRPYVSPSRRK